MAGMFPIFFHSNIPENDVTEEYDYPAMDYPFTCSLSNAQVFSRNWEYVNHEIVGWSNASDGSGTIYAPDATVTITGYGVDDQFYAVWESTIKVNKVVLGNRTLLDLTADTVTPSNLALGITAHAADGKEIVGTMDAYSKSEIDNLLDAKADLANYIVNGTTDGVSLQGDVAVSAGGLLKVVSVRVTWTVASGDAQKTTTISAAAVQSAIGSGWTPVGIVGWNSASYLWYVRACYLDNGAITFSTTRRDSTASGSDSFNGSARVLCVRTSL